MRSVILFAHRGVTKVVEYGRKTRSTWIHGFQPDTLPGSSSAIDRRARVERVTCFVRLKYYGVQRDAFEDRSEEKEASLGAQRLPR